MVESKTGSAVWVGGLALVSHQSKTVQLWVSVSSFMKVDICIVIVESWLVGGEIAI